MVNGKKWRNAIKQEIVNKITIIIIHTNKICVIFRIQRRYSAQHDIVIVSNGHDKFILIQQKFLFLILFNTKNKQQTLYLLHINMKLHHISSLQTNYFIKFQRLNYKKIILIIVIVFLTHSIVFMNMSVNLCCMRFCRKVRHDHFCIILVIYDSS